MALVRLVELERRALRDRFRERETRGDHQRVVAVPRARVRLGELSGHLRPVLVRPRHEKDRSRAVLSHDVALLLRVRLADGLELWADGALAAVHYDHRVELLPRRVENDLVVRGEGVLADAVGAEVGLHVVPVDARAADGRRHAARFALRIRGGRQAQHVAVHAVVVIEEAVAYPEDGLRRLAAELGARGPGLRARN